MINSCEKKTVEITPDTKQSTVKFSRKNVEYSGCELIYAVCALLPAVTTKDEISNIEFNQISEKLKGCDKTEFDKYKEDVRSIKPKKVKTYIENIHKSSPPLPQTSDIQYVYLEGKTLKSPELIALNKGVDNKKAKADVYIKKTTENKYIGYSIKQNDKCTKTNYSVEKILGDFIPNKQERKLYKKQFSEARTGVIEDALGAKTVQKSQRKEANELFYNSLGDDNPYWSVIRSKIKANIDEIKKKLVESMFPTDSPYDMYEFDGIETSKLNITSDMDGVSFREHPEYYHDGNDLTKRRRQTAKMFYQLCVNGKKYRIELRWKGDCKGSVQFQTHLDKHASPMNKVSET
tara:strand:- start:43 stop:1086 length:1044 start_codon:yes stop_codon:yes gene_type:complete